MIKIKTRYVDIIISSSIMFLFNNFFCSISTRMTGEQSAREEKRVGGVGGVGGVGICYK